MFQREINYAWTLLAQATAVLPRIWAGARYPRRWYAALVDPASGALKRSPVDSTLERRLDAQATPVAPRVLLSGACVASDRVLLSRLGVTHICNATIEIPRYFQQSQRLEYHKTSWTDDDKSDCTTQEYRDAFEFIQSALASDSEHVVLVHCFAGRSRSASIVLYYLCRTQSLKLQQGMLQLYAMRPIVMINDNFLRRVTQTLAEDAGQDASPEAIAAELASLSPNFCCQK
jgi:hypothetical protein